MKLKSFTPVYRLSFIFYHLSFIVYLFSFLVSPVFAQHFSSPSYIIDWGNFNITSGKKSSTHYSLTDTVGQNAPGQFNSSAYIVKSGFQYIYDTYNQFSFTISNLSLNLGSLVPGVASTATTIITISTPSGHGYQIMAGQNHPLSLSDGTTIPDTKCDDNTCTESLSRPWILSTTYGFGLNALGIDSSGTVTNVGTSQFFSDSTYFRQFTNLSSTPPKSPQIIMAEDSPVKNHSARISSKAVVSATQAAGNYQNSLIFTAIPKY